MIMLSLFFTLSVSQGDYQNKYSCPFNGILHSLLKLTSHKLSSPLNEAY